jgi:hypothetical protein
MFGLDWFGRRKKEKKKKKALDECISVADGLNLSEHDSVWQNSVKACMAKKGYKHKEKKSGPSASIASSYEKK